MPRTSLLLLPLLAALLTACATPPSASPSASASKPTPAPVAKVTTKTRMKAADQRAILAYHNKVRADVGVGPLRWNAQIAGFAQQWADHLATSSCQMQHRQPNDYGENLFIGTAGYYSAVDAAKGWESEKKLYHGSVITESNYHPIGHYTQMVWRDTTMVGCGEAVCNGMLLVVCNYNPPGNYLGHKPY